MATGQKPKASEKQAVCKKLTLQLKKRYKGSPPKSDLPVLETILFAVCLENSSYEAALASYQKLFEEFHDLNEIRVSSITELTPVFASQSDADWRAYRIRQTLQTIFEQDYSYDMESLRKKTLDSAQKTLSKLKHLTPFVRNCTLHEAIGAHLVPMDDRTASAAIWCGLESPGVTPEEVGEGLKPVIRKAEAEHFCYLLRSLANDPELEEAFEFDKNPPPEEGFDLQTAPNRLDELFKNGPPKKKTSPPKVKKTPKADKSDSAEPPKKKKTSTDNDKPAAKRKAKAGK